MNKLLPLACASVVFALISPVSVLAQGLGAPPGQYGPAPILAEGQDQYVAAGEDPGELPQYAANDPDNQYAPPADCSDPSCGPGEDQPAAGEVEEDLEDVVENTAEGASGSSEDLDRALDTAAPHADGGDRPASGSLEGSSNDAPGPSRKTAAATGADEDASRPVARSTDSGGADGPEGAGQSLGRGGPPVLEELPETGGAPSVSVVLGVVASFLLVGGLLVRKIVVR